MRRPTIPTLFPYTTLFRSVKSRRLELARAFGDAQFSLEVAGAETNDIAAWTRFVPSASSFVTRSGKVTADVRSEEHTSELQSRLQLVCRLLLEKKKNLVDI